MPIQILRLGLMNTLRLSGYQEINIPGSFPTVQWFNHFPKTRGDVLDLGCNDGMLSILYRKHGARSVVGVDNNIECVENATALNRLHKCESVKFIHQSIEDFVPESYDVAIFSMIIHWLKDPKEIIKNISNKTRDNVIFIWRLPNKNYTIPDNGNYFPDLRELICLMDDLGFVLDKHRMLEIQDNGKCIDLAVFKRDRAVKTHERCTKEWEHKFEEIQDRLVTPFINFIPQGYITKYIDGIDLYGNKPFDTKKPERETSIHVVGKKKVASLFADICLAGIDTGFLLGDVTRRNIILDLRNGNLYPIDFDLIVDANNIPQDTVNVFQEMLKYLELDYIFTGNLRELYKILRNEE